MSDYGQGQKLYQDFPRQEIKRAMEEALAEGWHTYFKFTCEECGERCMLAEPNCIYERGECCKCGHETALTKGNYMKVKRNVGVTDLDAF